MLRQNEKWYRILRGFVKEKLTKIKLLRILRNIEYCNPILVYQMGKVGSSTIVKTLQSLNIDCPSLHIHTLNKNNLRKAMIKQKASPSPFFPEHLLTSSILIKKLSKGNFPCQIITLTREPVSRAISFVFEDWQKKIPNAKNTQGHLELKQVQSAITSLLSLNNGIADPGLWFDNELRECFGVDVFSYHYDINQGYMIIEKDPVKVLVLRMEDLNRVMGKALKAFLGFESKTNIIMHRSNSGAKKWYADDLRSVKNTYKLPPHIAEQVLSTQYVQHFYADIMDELWERWVET